MAQIGTVAEYEFEVELGGQMVACATLADAVAIKTANDILLGDDPTPYSSEQLAPLAGVLIRYGYARAAELLG